MKRCILMLLTLCMICGLSMNAYAASMSPSADKTTVTAGEDVTVTVRLDQDIQGVTTIAYKVYFDSSLFTLKKSSSGTSIAGVATSGVKSDAAGSYVNISYLDPTSEGVTLKAGSFAVLTFTAKQDIAQESSATFRVKFENCMSITADGQLDFPSHSAGGPVNVKVVPAGPVETQPPASTPTATQPPASTPAQTQPPAPTQPPATTPGNTVQTTSAPQTTPEEVKPQQSPPPQVAPEIQEPVPPGTLPAEPEVNAEKEDNNWKDLWVWILLLAALVMVLLVLIYLSAMKKKQRQKKQRNPRRK